MRYLSRQSGFTLVELVVVIVVLGAISAGTAVYIVRSMEAYSDTVRRDQLTSTARVAVEKITRELRNALPNSVRTYNNDQCIQYIPVNRGSSYQNIPLTAANISFSAIENHSPDNPIYVVVYPYDRDQLYIEPTTSPGSIVEFDNYDPSTGTVTLGQNYRFSHGSPRKRFYFTATPVSYCVTNSQKLMRYNNNLTGNLNQQPLPPEPLPPGSNWSRVADNIQLTDGGNTVFPFAYTEGTLQRNAVVTLDFRFMEDSEWVRLLHEVQIRNVP
ncbi:MAG: prepilin-type N-terminal cleavage/methylation domain-containing protein [Pseudomonadota bacterium]|nr:prepilin-type N-terminal cleavage/methylation domain-containing protein [Pseudomonadota bacterium]